MGGQISPTRTKNGPNRAKNGVFVPKIPFFAEFLFSEHTLSEDIILNGGSPTINFALHRLMVCCKSFVNKDTKSDVTLKIILYKK